MTKAWAKRAERAPPDLTVNRSLATAGKVDEQKEPQPCANEKRLPPRAMAAAKMAMEPMSGDGITPELSLKVPAVRLPPTPAQIAALKTRKRAFSRSPLR